MFNSDKDEREAWSRLGAMPFPQRMVAMFLPMILMWVWYAFLTMLIWLPLHFIWGYGP